MKKIFLVALFFFGFFSVSHAADVTMYAATSTGSTFSNFNDNAPLNNYAWSFQLDDVGSPKTFRISNNDSASASASFCLMANRVATSTSYGCTATSTLTAGWNSFALTATSTMESTSTVFWVYMSQTSATTNPARLNYVFPGSRNGIYRSSASNINPDTFWFSGNIAFEIIGDPLPSPPAPTASSTLLLVNRSSTTLPLVMVVLILGITLIWISRTKTS